MNKFKKLKNEGIIILDQIIPKELFGKLKNGFFDHDKFLESHKIKSDEKDLIEKRAGYEKIIDYCPEIIEIINLKEIDLILKNYLGQDYKILNIYPTVSYPVKLDMTEKNVHKSDASICIFHHDQIGKQLKLIIVLEDIIEDQNCLEYAVGSHKVNFIDKIIIKFFNFFGLFKDWNKNIVEHLINKILNKPIAFTNEKNLRKKYSIKQAISKASSIYLFDTNGYHRQKPATEKTNFSLARNTIFLDIVPNLSAKKAKLKMNFKSVKEESYKKIENFI